MSVVFITGSSGLVGSESVNFFCDKGFDVIGIDNNLRKFFFGKESSTNWVKKYNTKKIIEELINNNQFIFLKVFFLKDNIAS